MIPVTMAEIIAFCGGELINVSCDTVIKKAETDSRKDMTAGIFFALKGERFDAHDFVEQAMANNAAVLCVQKNRVSEKLPCWIVDDTLKAYQQLGKLMLKKNPVPCAAVTGSVGKTSVKEMTRAVLEQKFGSGKVLFTEGNTNNHIGVPQNLLRMTYEYQAAVIEMGTSSFGEIAVLTAIVEPEIAVVNSIAPCHLENLCNLDGVAREKASIFDCTSKTAVFPGNIPQTEIIVRTAAKRGLQCVRFGSCPAENIDVYYSNFSGGIFESSFLLHCGTESVRINWNLQGEHQAQNACAAAAVGKYFGMTLSEIAAGLKNTVLPGMRAKITVCNGVNIYNDAYNANPASMRAVLKMAAESVKNGEIAEKDLIFVIGDMLELGENSALEHLSLLEDFAEQLPQAQVLAVGSNFMQHADRFEMKFFADSVEAGIFLRGIAHKGNWIFLKGSRSMHMENALSGDDWKI